ncbi:hypothetical protein BDV96DRAFT_522445, partial [Lophiotrema nucula]
MQPFVSPTPAYYAPQPPAQPSTPKVIPQSVYRVQHTKMQTKYSFSEGFRAKNQTTILNQCSNLSNFGVAHLNHQTNISSPFISVYASQCHAYSIAEQMARNLGEKVSVVEVDTGYLARGPVFRAEDVIGERIAQWGEEERRLHHTEYLIMYRIPAQAIRGVVK